MSAGSRRFLNVHEYASMEIMRSHGIPVPKTQVAHSAEEAGKVYKDMIGAGNDCVIKAMVLTGGRGLGHFDSGLKGGVHIVSTGEELTDLAGKMIGNNLITKQTGAGGLPCNKVMVAERMYLRREMYLSMMLDRAAGGPMFVASPAGGTSIEDVAEATPELIFTRPIDISVGVTDADTQFIATSLGFSEGTEVFEECRDVVKKLYSLFREKDCTLLEINPFAETPTGKVMVCDAKINFDDNAEYRQGAVFEYRDLTQEDPREVHAAKFDLNYIGLDGNIGCMVNGAGLAMSTMDIIKLKGGEPANFLDVGGGATEEQVQRAFELLNSDNNVKAIFVNIFGGIMKCDIIANGVINAAQNIGLKKPVIIRLKGTNVEAAKELIKNSPIKMVASDDFDDAANKAVKIANIVSAAEEVNLEVQFS
eukprot:CAMPEP_0116911986 /NCGR_PEP_ID=MMETSP0467-20121206/15815_1 /TAXON_ID=283647 /ORGANISM="Mesodinium pulex, Strain SPMC105" /LENGTH=420 /DNA_ID=CAMNT_0004587875 /DNA_START=73 /DNA_END=1335 /DNA_ORIENTATION=-